MPRNAPHNQPMPPASRMRWTPGPSGEAQPPTVSELAGWLVSEQGQAGVHMERGRAWEHGETYAVVMRLSTGVPVGILVLRMYEGTPGLVDFAVEPHMQRIGIAKALAVEAKRHGIDLRETGAIWEGPLTGQGTALRDSLVAWARDFYGPASWENGNGS